MDKLVTTVASSIADVTTTVKPEVLVRGPQGRQGEQGPPGKDSDAITFLKEISASDFNENNTYRIPIYEHNVNMITDINALSLEEDEYMENIDFSYRIYKSGSIEIILDKAINVKIIIRGEK
jgi:hypothetical protein